MGALAAGLAVIWVLLLVGLLRLLRAMERTERTVASLDPWGEGGTPRG